MYRYPLSEDFVREVQNKLDQEYILDYQTLAECYIRQVKYQVDWHNIPKKLNLS